VFSQVLEKALHAVVLTNFPHFTQHPWLFGVYGGMAAGIFEEFGRFLFFTWFLKKYYDYKGGISCGIGWGGIEAIIIMLAIVVPNIIIAIMINIGTFETAFSGKIPNHQLAALKASVLNHGASFYLLGCAERLFTVFLHIALSLLILLAVVKKKFTYCIYAVLIHAIFDYPAALYQTGTIKNIWIIELYIAIIGFLSLIFIKKAEKLVSGTTRGHLSTWDGHSDTTLYIQ